MEKIGLFYSFNSTNTSKTAALIAQLFSDDQIDKINVEILAETRFTTYNNFILGVPTWFDGELPTYWDEFGPAIEDMDLMAKNLQFLGWEIKRVIRKILMMQLVLWQIY